MLLKVLPTKNNLCCGLLNYNNYRSYVVNLRENDYKSLKVIKNVIKINFKSVKT